MPIPSLVTLICSATLALAAGAASAQPFPTRPVRIMVPFSAGGLTDVLARGLAQELARAWGQPVLVDNRPGANTIIAAELTAKSPPDGYTILMANDPTLSSNQYLYSRLPYDPVRDFAPVINLVASAQLLVANNELGVRTVPELIAAAKAKPGQIAYGSFGMGSKSHLDGEAFALATGTKLNHVPYKGIADVLPAAVSGQIQIAFSGMSPAIPYVRGGRLRAIAIASSTRSPQFPDVPTFAEAGLPGFESRSWFGLVAPAGTPRPVVDKIAADVAKVVSQPEFMEKYVTGVGLELLNQGPDQFAEFLKANRAEYAVRAKNVNVKLD